jgi:CRISPR-associated protein Cmr4
MNNNASVTRFLWLHALSPIHIGAGRGVGYIDLPVVREKVTDWPYVPASSVKGILADHFDATEKSRADNEKKRAAFGTSGVEYSNSGSLMFTDARLVCLPVRSLFGTFAWVTSPLALRRLLRDLEMADLNGKLEVPENPATHEICTTGDSCLTDRGGKVFLEDLDLNLKKNEQKVQDWTNQIKQWVFQDENQWQEEFSRRFVLVADDVFTFLCRTATEVSAHVRLKLETKAVEEGPWYEEALPAETILAGFVTCGRVYSETKLGSEDLLNEYCKTESPLTLQLGGKATAGKGRIRCRFTASTAVPAQT